MARRSLAARQSGTITAPSHPAPSSGLTIQGPGIAGGGTGSPSRNVGTVGTPAARKARAVAYLLAVRRTAPGREASRILPSWSVSRVRRSSAPSVSGAIGQAASPARAPRAYNSSAPSPGAGTIALTPASGGSRGSRLARTRTPGSRSEEHTSELQSRGHLVCRLLLEKKKKKQE